jgi:uncharacterized protein (TIGR03437 family)
MRFWFIPFAALVLPITGTAQPADPVWVPGSSQKICQLTGDTDFETGQPTLSRTETNYGLVRADVGYSFDHNGQIWFLFGDATPTPTFNGSPNGSPPRKVAYDSPGFTSGTDITQCLKLDFPKNSIGSYVNPVIVDAQGKEAVTLGVDEYLVAGMDVGGRMFVIGATDNDVTNPTVGNLGQPTRTVMAVSDDNGQTYHYLYEFSDPPCSRCDGAKFVNVAAAPGTDGYVYFWGTQGGMTSNQSSVFLARKTATLAQSGGIQYFGGFAQDGVTPSWASSENGAISLFQDYNGNPPQPANCARQLGVQYNKFVQRWMMLYTCGNVTTANLSGFYLRFAAQPWGPWGAPQTVFNADRDRGICRFIHRVPTTDLPPCDNLSDPDRLTIAGTHYAPYFISDFTSGNPDGTSTFYYTMATFNPYTQLIMKATIQPAGAATPVIGLVANAEGEGDTIAPNTWIEIKGLNLAPPGDSRVWKSSDFVNNQLPKQLDGVSVTVNGKAAYVSYISPTQVNVITPPDPMLGTVQVQLTNNGSIASYAVQAQSTSPSFFSIISGQSVYVLAQHADYSLIGPSTLNPGVTTPAKPGETILMYANGFGPTSTLVVSGSPVQGGTLSPLPVVQIGGLTATVQFAGLVNWAPGVFQFNVTVPPNAPTGNNTLTAAYHGQTTSANMLLAVQP